MPRTKIVCTLGPACDAPGVLRDMLRAGMDVARINFSHGDHASHARRIADVRRMAQEEGRTLAILCDLQGPKLRVGEIAGGAVELAHGGRVTLTTRAAPGDAGQVNLPHPDLVADVQPGQRLLLDDGALELQVESKTDTDLVCSVVVGGVLGSHKGVSAPGAALSLSSLTDKDRADAQFAVEQSADYIALSFVRRAADVNELRALLASHRARIPIVAKIEKAEALSAFDEILATTDAVMVARGDLGVETPPEQVPIHQKHILRACNRAGKPAITATQMLQSMIENPRPTRAEASDVANAVLDGTDAVMLSGETATGHYPVEAVRMMESVATIAEETLECEEWLRRVGEAASPSEAIARATVEIAIELGASAIITCTESGYTAQLVARYRPCVPVLAVTPDAAVYRQMALVWGVTPLLVPEYASTDEMIESTTRAAREAGLVKPGERVVITAGIPAGGEGQTNMLKVHVI
jgi:pyruvate kinase